MEIFGDRGQSFCPILTKIGIPSTLMGFSVYQNIFLTSTKTFWSLAYFQFLAQLHTLPYNLIRFLWGNRPLFFGEAQGWIKCNGPPPRGGPKVAKNWLFGGPTIRLTTKKIFFTKKLKKITKNLKNHFKVGQIWRVLHLIGGIGSIWGPQKPLGAQKIGWGPKIRGGGGPKIRKWLCFFF